MKGSRIRSESLHLSMSKQRDEFRARCHDHSMKSQIKIMTF